MILNWRGMIWLYISAYTPLFAVLIIKILSWDIFQDPYGLVLITILLLIFISIASLLFVNSFLKRAQELDAHWEEVKINQTKNEDYVIFIMTYLIPFFGIEINISTLAALLLLFIIIGYIYINSSLFSVNPVLNIIWGYNIYSGILYEQPVTILSKSKFRIGENDIKVISLAANIYLSKEESDEDE